MSKFVWMKVMSFGMTLDNFVPFQELNDIWDNSRSMANEKDKADAK